MIKKTFLLCCFLFCCGILLSQNLIDSLNAVYDTLSDPQKKLKVLNDLCTYHYFSNRGLSENYLAKYDSIARVINDERHINRVKILQGNIHYASEEYEKATELYLSALEGAEKRKDTASMASINNNLSAVFLRQSDTLSTLKFSKQALKLYEVIGSKKRLALGNLNLGTIYFETNQLDSAEIHLKNAIKYGIETRSMEMVGKPRYILGLIEKEKKNYQKALQLMKEAAVQIPPEKDPESWAKAHLNLADLLLFLERPTEAKKFLDKAELFIKQKDSKELRRELIRYKIAYFEKIKNYKSAFEASRESHKLRMKILNAEKNKNLKELITRYETVQKETDFF